jgi:uncharacterized protein (DUF58 family)
MRRFYGATFGRRRSLTLVTILTLVVFGIGFSTNFWLPLRLGYLLLFGLIAAALWTWLTSRGLQVRMRRDAERVQVGQTITEQLQVTNRSRLGKYWLEVEEESDLPEHQAEHVVSLGGRARRQWRVDTECRRRGLFTLGPVHVRAGDPFDLFHKSMTFGGPRQLLVYPRAVELPRYSVPPANLPGEGRFRRRTHYVTPNASGLREYAPGDSVNRIHWPSTLRTGRLHVKTFELDPASQLWVVLDMNRSDHAGADEEATVEYAVTAAASIARLFLGQNRSVGMMMFADRFRLIDADRGNQQLTRMLEDLAVAQPVGDVPISTLLAQQSPRWGRHTTVIVITAASDRRARDGIRALAQRGVQVAAVLIDAASFGGRAGGEEAWTHLRASGVQTNLIGRGDFLAEALDAARGAPGRAGVGALA